MLERTTTSLVTFAHPFSLPGVDGEQEPGTYLVETVEEPIGDLSFTAYRRVSTTIVLPSPKFGPGSRQVVTIEPRDLDAAKEQDARKAGQSE